MKIAILGTRGIPARYGGFETFAEQLAPRLVERGHDVTVFCEGAGSALGQFNGVKLHYLKSYELGPLSTVVFDAECLWKAKSSFDVVYMLGYGSSMLCWLPRLWGNEVWINMDGLEWARGKWGRIARFYFRLAEKFATWTANRIVADASAIKSSLQSRHRKLPLCDVIPYGCEIADSTNIAEPDLNGLTPGSYYLVVCRFEPENHVREIIEGFVASTSKARLVLVGDHTRDNAYVQSLVRCDDERLLFTGPIYEKSRIQALRFFCRAYLHGHSVGGTNPSLLEAMGCRSVVIAHDNPFNREVLGNSAIFFTNQRAVSSAIELVDSGAVDSESLKSGVMRRVAQFYTWEQITEHYCELLSLVGSQSNRRNKVIQRAPALSDETSGV